MGLKQFFWQMYPILYKDIFILRLKRHYISAIFELLVPLVVIIGMIISRNPPSSGRTTAGDHKLIRRGRAITIAFAPTTKYTTHIVKNLFAHPNTSFAAFADRALLERYLENTNRRPIVALNFNSGENPTLLNYTLKTAAPGENSFLSLDSFHQNLMGNAQLISLMSAIFQEHTSHDDLRLPPRALSLLERPLQLSGSEKNSSDDSYYQSAQYTTDKFLVIAFLVWISSIMNHVVGEKESRIREMLRMMGLSEAVYWVGTFTGGIIRGTIICLLLIAGLCPPIGKLAVFSHSDPSVVLIVFLVFMISLLFFTMCISVPFTSPKAATALIAVIMLVVPAYLSTFIDSQQAPPSVYLKKPAAVKLASSLLPFFGFHWSIKLLMSAEEAGHGLQWRNLWSPTIKGDNVAPASILAAMMCSCLLYMLVTLYLDAVIPWQYGIPKHPLFFLQRSYWCPGGPDMSDRALSDDQIDNSMIERVPDDVPVAVQLCNISHCFGSLCAVCNLSLKLYEHQITILLGHNGAGKTTVMNILTGIIAADEGEVLINGYSVRKNTARARASIGLCPQHNVLFDNLTVFEHLYFFGMIKGKHGQELKKEIRNLIARLDLFPKTSTFAKQLSGGMKRKLSLGIALVAGSKIVILDEPTTGVDPEGRRSIWSLLQEERFQRTILMTTHSMDEADVLADRIAFLSKGRLLCAGSPMFLKHKFETGYILRMCKTAAFVDAKKVTSFTARILEKDITSIQLVSDLGREFAINIGFPPAAKLANLFRNLEKSKDDLGIESFGISLTTMEDVFHKIGEEFEEHSASNDSAKSSRMEWYARIKPQVTGSKLVAQQLRALLYKRWTCFRRDWKMAWYFGMLPLLFIVLYCVVANVDVNAYFKPHSKSVRSVGDPPGNDPAMMKGVLQQRSDKGLRNDEAISSYFKENVTKLLRDSGQFDAVALRERFRMDSGWHLNQRFWIAKLLSQLQSAWLKDIKGMKGDTDFSRLPPVIRFAISILIVFLVVRLMASIFITLAVTYLICPIVIVPAQERVTKMKLIQLMTGVNPMLYILSNVIFDVFVLIISTLAIVLVLGGMNPMRAYWESWEPLCAVVVILMLYNVSVIPIIYVVSYLINDPASGITVLQNCKIISSVALSFVIGFMEVIMLTTGVAWNPIWVKMANFVPTFAVSWAISSIQLNGVSRRLCDSVPRSERNLVCKQMPQVMPPCCQACADGLSNTCFSQPSLFKFDHRFGIGYQIMSLTIVFIAFLALLIMVELHHEKFIQFGRSVKKCFTSCFGRMFSNEDRRANAEAMENSMNKARDADVIAEKQRVDLIVAEHRTDEFALVVHKLAKRYGSVRAVRGLSFLVNFNECFGLLGVNGAGKTTTFGMLTGDISPSSGNAYIMAVDLKSGRSKFRTLVGYCPQEDALANKLTAKEMLALFCALRGIRRDETDEYVDRMVTVADLTGHENKLTSNCSGGNKRKICIAIAMVGNPPLLYLDEPTAGVDPSARRKIWAMLSEAQRELGTSIVFTSHTMGECEALCHRLAIMVAGTFRCIGSSHHLKEKFGQMFTVYVKLATDSIALERDITAAMKGLYPAGCGLRESHQRLLKYSVVKTGLPWSQAFERIQKLQDRFHEEIEDVQVSETSLEEVFLSFTQQEPIFVADQRAPPDQLVDESLDRKPESGSIPSSEH